MTVVTMPKRILCALSLGIIICSSALGADAAKESKNKAHSEKTANSDEKASTQAQSDEGALKQEIARLSKAIADGDAKTVASMWLEDGDYIGVDGSVCKGRSNLEKRFEHLAIENGKQAIELLPNSIRFIAGGGAAIIEGVVRRNNGIEGPKPETRFSIVFAKKDGNWLISNATETPLLSHESVLPLGDLSWLVGEWSAEQNGGSVRMKAEWAANKNFITCQYEVKKSAEATPLESRQVIGWDPRTEQPVSWHFDSTGGFGYGNWVKKDKQWMVEATGVDRDGSTTSATNVLSITDPNGFSWQSVNRSVNGIAFNDTAPVKVHRVVK